MPYSIGEIKVFIRNVIREAKKTARVRTGYLKDSIGGDWDSRKNRIEFEQIFYGAYKDNSKLVEIAERIIPKDLNWVVVFMDEDGQETSIEGKTRTGRKLSTSKISSENVSTSKIKALISAIQANGKKTDDTGERSEESDNRKA